MNEKKKNIDYYNLGKILPQAVDLEGKILGGVMLYEILPEIFINVSKPVYFYKESNKLIANAIFHIVKELKLHPDIIIVTDYLKRKEELEIVGGAYYITQLTNCVPGSTTANFEYWCRIVQQCWMGREIIKISSESINNAYDIKNDVFEIINNTILQLEGIKPISNKEITLTKSISSVFNDIFLKNKGKIISYYEIASCYWDRIVGFSSGMTLIVGASGTGKTSFVTERLQKLLEIHYQYISIHWFNIDHETSGSTIRKFLSNKLKIDDKSMQAKGKKLDNDMLTVIVGLENEFSKYDIVFEEEQVFVDDIKDKFIDFCKKRIDRFNILVIDNIMKLRDYEKASKQNETSIENKISNSLSNLYNQTRKYNSQIIALHHFNQEQESKQNASEAYRPREEYIKGSSNFRNVFEQIILLNRPGKYQDILNKYSEYKSILKSLVIAEISKNTFGTTGIIYFFGNKYNQYKEVNCINEFIYKNIDL